MHIRTIGKRKTLAALALIGVAMTGCSRIHVTRTINSDATLIDDYRFEISEKGVGDHADMSGMRMGREFEGILKELNTGKLLVGDPSMKYKGEAVYTIVGDHAAKSGVLYESGKWLAAQKAVWTKLPDGGFQYELPMDVSTLPPAFFRGGIGTGGRFMSAQAQPRQPDPIEPDAMDEPPPPSIFEPETPPQANAPMLDSKVQEMIKNDELRADQAWKNLEIQVDLVMPGKITEANTKIIKDRMATWIIKPSEFLPDPKKKEAQTPPPPVFKVKCGPPLPAAKADEDRYKKYRSPAAPQK